jgi:uncharacterized protein (TIGR03437 family)
MLEGTAVTIGGQAAFISAVAPDRILALVPANIDPGTRQLTVSTTTGTSGPYDVQVVASVPSLLAPPSFVVDGKQYASAIFPDGITYAAPDGAIADTESRPAHPGETVTVYGMGFGPVTPDLPIGTKARDSGALSGDLEVSIGGMPATVTNAGLAPGQVSVYQFDVVVPEGTPGGAVPLTFQLDGAAGRQELYIEVTP